MNCKAPVKGWLSVGISTQSSTGKYSLCLFSINNLAMKRKTAFDLGQLSGFTNL